MSTEKVEQMKNITIDEEFKSLLPVLDKETRMALEENLIQNGCRDAIVLWNGILIDGHNRYEICMENDIAFNTIDMEFGSREEVIIWIITNQVSRRNLSPIQLSHYRGLHYKAEKVIIKNSGGKNQYSSQNEVKSHNETKPKDQSTATRLANKYNVSRNTIIRDSKVAEAIDAIGEISPEAKRKILSGEANIDKKELSTLPAMTNKEIEEAAVKIAEGTYARGKHERETDGSQVADAGKIADSVYSELRKLTADGGRAELKTVLRACIDRLEEIYRNI